MNNSSLSRKKYVGGNFTPTIRQRLRGQNTSMGIGLIEFTESSDTLNYKPCLKHWFLKTILHVIFIVYICEEQNLKN